MQLFVISLMLCLALLVNLILVEIYGKELPANPRKPAKSPHSVDQQRVTTNH